MRRVAAAPRAEERSPAPRASRSRLRLAVALALAIGCGRGSGAAGVVELSAADFSTRLGASPEAQLVDVRTPAEFARGHLARAINVDWNGADFDRRAARLDRTRPVFVYCLTGSRSGEAAAELSRRGFAPVVDLAGGILKWRAAGLPQVAEGEAPRSMTRAEFEALVAGEPPVLVDFYADWCIPCRRMKPDLEALAAERATSLRVERIDADRHQALLRELGIDALPALALYRRGALVASRSGFATKRDMIALVEGAR